MATLRLYRYFYCINSTTSLSADTYTLINPESIVAKTVIRGNTNVIETPSVVFEDTGKYYVELDRALYNIDDIYELSWIVKYTTSAPERTLHTRFKLYPRVVGQGVDIRVLGNEIDIRLANDEIRLENDNNKDVRVDNDNVDLGLDGGIKLEI